MTATHVYCRACSQTHVIRVADDESVEDHAPLCRCDRVEYPYSIPDYDRPDRAVTPLESVRTADYGLYDGAVDETLAWTRRQLRHANPSGVHGERGRGPAVAFSELLVENLARLHASSIHRAVREQREELGDNQATLSGWG